MSKVWIKTADKLPTREFLKSDFALGCVDKSHADCFIFVNGRVQERPFNFDHECWDRQDYDDFEYEADEPSHWMLCDPWPLPPSIEETPEIFPGTREALDNISI